MNPIWIAPQVGLHIGRQRIGNLGGVAGSPPKGVASASCLHGRRAATKILEELHLPILVHDAVALKDGPPPELMFNMTIREF